MTPEQALDLLVKTNISPENVKEAEVVLRAALKAREPVSSTTDVCPVCEAPGVTVQDRDGTAHFERTEPEVLATGWAARDNPWKVRTPKGHSSDIPVAIIAREP